MMNRKLNVNITAQAINDFFTTLKPAPPPQQNNRLPGTVQIHDPAALQQHINNEKATASYTILTETRSYDVDNYSDYVSSQQEHVESLDSLEDSIPEPKPLDHPAFNVYDNYKFEHTYDPSLPITEHRDWVVGTIESNQVTIIQGATGSGKTTQVPQYILDYYYEQRKYCNIVVTQPRRIAAQSIANRVSQERNWPLGNVIGYQVARDRKVSEDTRITYLTTGVLLEKLISKKNMNEYTHIVLDEIHERDQDIDLAMLIVKKFLRTVSKHCKVILMSATMDCSLFSKYFSVQIRGQLEGAPVVSVEGKMYDVSTYHLDNLKSLGEIPPQSQCDPEITTQCYQMAKALIMEFDRNESNMQGLAEGEKFPIHRGTALVFLPGYPEIDAMHKHLENIEHERNLQVLILHSQITSQDQAKIFMKAQPGKRKVILSTNIAESSITVPDIKYGKYTLNLSLPFSQQASLIVPSPAFNTQFIDFCLVKNLETDRDTNYQCLRLAWAPIASLEQRKGRAGRVSDGECFRLITKDFESRLPAYGVPEMQRCPLSRVILHVKSLNIGDPCNVLRLALQPPDINDIRRTILHLKEVGALTVKQNGRINPFDGDMTFVGKVLEALPVDVRVGKMIILGQVFGCLEECLIIAASLSLKSVFARPFKKEFEAYSHKMDWARSSFSDCIAALNVYREWKANKTNFGFGRQGENGWGRKHFVETKILREIDQLVSELGNRLRNFNIYRPEQRMPHSRNEMSQNDLLILKIVLCGAFYPFYFTSGEIDDFQAMKALSGHDPFSTVVVNNVPSPGVMYKSRIAALFRPCGKGKYLHFESSRCYVEFEKHNQSNSRNSVLPAVYLAIKMRQLRMPLELLVSKTRDDELRRRLENLELQNPTAATASLRSDRITASLDGNVQSTSKQYAKQVELKTRGYFEIHVTSVIDAGHFWAHYGDKETFTALHRLQNDINAMAGANLTAISHGISLQKDQIVLAFYDDGEFYRARIISTMKTPENQELIQVFYLDYGNSGYVSRESIRICPEAFLEYPFQAIECRLCNIRPTHGEWTVEANEMFDSIAQDKRLLAKIYSVVQNCTRLDLYEDDHHINDALIQAGFAQACEEPHVSKMARQDSETKAKALSESQALLKEVDDAVDSYDIEDYDAKRITLRGPSSPYEMQFYNMTYNGKFRSTRVERDSVNSVFMCEEPQDKHAILMLSANVGINAVGNTLLARETTVMPNIHGLASIIPVLFAPFAEFRLDKTNSRYIGAICGLGYIEETGSPIMPEHDIEVSFDVKFTKFDFTLLNSVRRCINLALSDESHLGSSAVEKVQQAARKRALELIYAKRDDVEPISFSKPYSWNEIPQSIRFKVDSKHEENPSLYTMHAGILFDDSSETNENEANGKKEEVRQLYHMAGRSTEFFQSEVVCPLCNVICRHPRALGLHLDSRVHRTEEAILYQKKGK
eukprot:gene20227-22203_t